RAAGKSARHQRLDRVLDEQTRRRDSGDKNAHDQQCEPGLTAPGRRRLELVGNDRCGASGGSRLAHFRAAAAAIAWTRPCVVYSRATIATSRPSLRAVSAVTGPMQAISASPRMAGN